MTSLHHAGLVVTDLVATQSFFERHFDAKVEMGPFPVTDPRVAELNGWPAVDFQVLFLTIGDSGRLELLQFATPTSARPPATEMNTLGIAHVAIEVADIEAMYRRMREDGVEFAQAPLEMLDENGVGPVMAFCRDPDGNIVELMEFRLPS